MFKYLSEKALEKLVKEPGKYKMEDNSALSARLQVWWVLVAGWMPNWLSANVITVAAVGPLALCYAVMAACWSSPSGSAVPRVVQALCAFSVFFFQTMDAVDGKQARRLGTSSPLGDFLDHVIDAVCIMLSVCSLALACNFRPLAFELVCLLIASADFLVVHWESAKIMVMTMDNGSSITEA
jgi:phosphatidylglycerophosphate synthase